MKYEDLRGKILIDFPEFEVKTMFISKSYKNVFRGFHKSPYPKIMYIVSGSIKETYINEDGTYNTIILKEFDSFLLKSNTVHGYLALDDTIIVYLLGGNDINRKIYYKSPDLPFEYNLPSNVIISEDDKNSGYLKDYDFLLLGGTGYIGSNFSKYSNCLIINNRLDDLDGIREHLNRTRIKHLVCAAGISKPGSTVEWCETHEDETKKVNYTDVLGIIQLCQDLNVHFTYFGSCLNHGKTVYAKWRRELENKIQGNVLYLKIMYPCTFDGHPKCFATKMKNRIPDNKRVTITNVNELFPQLPNIIKSNTCGVYNLVSHGTIHLSELSDIKVNYDDEPIIEYYPASNL